MTVENGEELLKLSEVKDLLKCSLSHAHALVGSGQLRCVRIGLGGKGGIRVSRAALEEFLRRRAEAGDQPSQPPAPKKESASGFNVLDADRLRQGWQDRSPRAWPRPGAHATRPGRHSARSSLWWCGPLAR